MSAQASNQKVSWNHARPDRVVLISGPEAFLAQRAWESIRHAMRERDPQVEIHALDAAEYAGGELLTYASPSLFAEPRLIYIESMEKCTDVFIEDAKQYLEQPEDDTVLVLRHGGGNRGKAVLDRIRKGGSGFLEVVCPEVKVGERASLVQAEFSRLGVPIDALAVRALTDAFQEDLAELMSACEQIAQNADGRVLVEDVERITGGRVEANAFNVAEAALSGNATGALVLLRQSLATGHEPMQILAGINFLVRAMARVHGIHASSAELARELKVAPWQVQRSQKAAARWIESDLARVIDEAAQTELMLKGGSRTPEYALERFVLLIARQGRPAR